LVTATGNHYIYRDRTVEQTPSSKYSRLSTHFPRNSSIGLSGVTIIQGEEEYEVEAILDHRGGKHRRQYLIKWKGYPSSDVTWELRRALHHVPDVVNHYESTLEG
jgi:hypothetical protein